MRISAQTISRNGSVEKRFYRFEVPFAGILVASEKACRRKHSDI
jgi:hypothetical protein